MYLKQETKQIQTKTKMLIKVVILASICACAFACSNGVDVNGTCICDPTHAGDNCDYQRKSALTANLLEWIPGAVGIAGVGMIYLGYLALGISHLIVRLCCCATSSYAIHKYRTSKLHFEHEETDNDTTNWIGCLLCCCCELVYDVVFWAFIWVFGLGMLIWYLVCGIQIAVGMPDANGVALV